MFSTKSGVAKLCIASVSLLILLKVVASILTGSVSIRADAYHSVLDLAGASGFLRSLRARDSEMANRDSGQNIERVWIASFQAAW